jgi:hypothetical protein
MLLGQSELHVLLPAYVKKVVCSKLHETRCIDNFWMIHLLTIFKYVSKLAEVRHTKQTPHKFSIIMRNAVLQI